MAVGIARVFGLALLASACNGEVGSADSVWDGPGTAGTGNGASGASAQGGSGTSGANGSGAPGAGNAAGGAATNGGAAPGTGGTSATTGGSGGTAEPQVAPGEFSRLTRAEYRATVEAALGVDPELNLIPEDGRVGHYTSNLGVTPDPVHPYMLAGEDLAAAAIPAELAACPAADALNCIEEQYRAPLEKLYRRTLGAAEIDALANVITAVAAESGTAEEATRSMLATALMSPDFLFRATPSNGGANPSARRLAERMSYVLWDAPPDSALTDAVADAPADFAQTLGAQGARMSRDARATPVLARFLAQWLDVDTDLRLEDEAFATSPDYLELLAFVEDALENDTPVTEFVGGRRGFVHRDNADVYDLDDLPGGQGDVVSVEWPEDSVRRGLLTEELLAGSTRHPDHSRRPIFRGLLVRRSLLCDTIDPPDASLVALAGEVMDRTTDIRCAGCHSMLDPIGRTFASLDQDNEGTVEPAEVLNHAELSGTYANVAELLEAVAATRAFAECFSRNWLSFFLEQPLVEVDPTWIAVLADSVQAGASLGAIVEQTAVELTARSGPLTPWCTGQ